MKRYYVESRIQEISSEIKKLIDKNIITHEIKIVLYELDTYSFGMRTVLENFGYPVESYVVSDKIKSLRVKRDVKLFSARYFNPTSDLIDICTVEERLVPYDESAVILVASKGYEEIKQKLMAIGYEEGVNFFCIYDWSKDSFMEMMQGKREMTTQEVQAQAKEMLAFVDDFCSKRGIRYWVCGGTLLGTIRHKGFIPWDDDVDVFMPWEDYQRFVNEFVDDETYELIGPDRTNREDYFELFSKIIDHKTLLKEEYTIIKKVHPVSIDIFPLIGLPNDAEERKLFFAEYYELEKIIKEDSYASNGSFSVYTKWYPEQKAFLEKYSFDIQQYAGVLSTIYEDRDYAPRNVYSDTLRMPFEDIEVNVPIGYKEYLDNLYGEDWMELPDESKRNSHHHMVAYWL